jgi:hypothetical protein
MAGAGRKWLGLVVLSGAIACGETGERGVAALEPAVTTVISQVAPIGGGNALTLPAQRHLSRIAPASGPVWLLGVQQDGHDGHGLVFFRSDDDGRSFHFYAPIQNNNSLVRDTTDQIVVGSDVALVYSFEGPVLSGSTSFNVDFQWGGSPRAPSRRRPPCASSPRPRARRRTTAPS